MLLPTTERVKSIADAHNARFSDIFITVSGRLAIISSYFNLLGMIATKDMKPLKVVDQNNDPLARNGVDLGFRAVTTCFRKRSFARTRLRTAAVFPYRARCELGNSVLLVADVWNLDFAFSATADKVFD